ncbi:MAG: BatB protein [Moraxellaceae bacterium]|nr:MAG: BatB protein [Moraxellaceae bacterium]
MIIFEWLWVWLLFPLPWIFKLILPKTANADQAMLRVPFFDNVKELADKNLIESTRKPLRFRFLLFIIWLLLLTAAAGPMHLGEPVVIHAEARDLMLAVDVSGSMRQQDLRVKGEQVDRLEAVKSVLKEFIQQRATDRMGLILFGSNAYLQTPLTFDKKTLGILLNEAQIGIAGRQTAIGDAIGLALKRLKDRPAKSKVLILLTDGANTAGQIAPIQAAKLAAEKQLKIYTIGVGADEMVTPGMFGSGFGSRRINPSLDLDEEVLTSIAEITGGQYYRARNTEDLRHIYDLLDELEPTEANPETFRPVQSLFYWPLGLAMLLTFAIAIHSIIRSASKQKHVSQPDNIPTSPNPKESN